MQLGGGERCRHVGAALIAERIRTAHTGARLVDSHINSPDGQLARRRRWLATAFSRAQFFENFTHSR